MLVGMDEMDFVILVGREALDRWHIKLLKSYGFVVVNAALPGVYRKVLHEERDRDPVMVDDARYSFYLKLFAMGLTRYDGVFLFDLDAQPRSNLFQVSELAWLSPGLRGTSKGAPPEWELYYASEEDTAILGGYMVIRPNASRCESMYQTLQRPRPW